MGKVALIAPMIVLIAAAPAKHGPWESYQRQQTSWGIPVSVSGSDGHGHEASCADAANNMHDLSLAYWIYGYFTGRNMGSTTNMVGHTTDSAGIIGEVKLYCDTHPSATVTEATTQTYLKMAREGR